MKILIKIKNSTLFLFRLIPILGMYLLLILTAIFMPKKAKRILNEWDHEYY